MKDFLRERLPKKPGNIIDLSGKIIGTHEGAYFYTIGQRKGIEIGGGPALFVIDKNTVENYIIVGPEDALELYSTQCFGKKWQQIIPESTIPENVSIKLRYRQSNEPGEITIT